VSSGGRGNIPEQERGRGVVGTHRISRNLGRSDSELRREILPAWRRSFARKLRGNGEGGGATYRHGRGVELSRQ
jgi:hypothetical protein